MPVDPRIKNQFLQEEDLAARLLVLDYLQDEGASEGEIEDIRQRALVWMANIITDSVLEGDLSDAETAIATTMSALNIPTGDSETISRFLNDVLVEIDSRIADMVDPDEDAGEATEMRQDRDLVSDITTNYVRRIFPQRFNLEGRGAYQRNVHPPQRLEGSKNPEGEKGWKTLRDKYKSLNRYYC